MLTGGREQASTPTGEEWFLERDCRAYRFTLDGTEDGVRFSTVVDWLVSGPYLLRRELRDADNQRGRRARRRRRRRRRPRSRLTPAARRQTPDARPDDRQTRQALRNQARGVRFYRPETSQVVSGNELLVASR